MAAPSLGGGAVRVLLRLRPPSDFERSVGSRVIVSAAASRSQTPLSTPRAVDETPLGRLSAALRPPESAIVILAARRAGGRTQARGAHAHVAMLPELQTSLDGVIMPAALSSSLVNDQELVFACVHDVIAAVAFQGRNGTIFAYGATGSGKTHTMMGTGWDTAGDMPEESSWGLIPRAVVELLGLLRTSHGGDAIASGRVIVEATYLEVYNGRAYDLLAQRGSPPTPVAPHGVWGVMNGSRGRTEIAPSMPLIGASDAGRYGARTPEPWSRAGSRGVALPVREGHHGCECCEPNFNCGGGGDGLVQVSLWATEPPRIGTASAPVAEPTVNPHPCSCGPSLRVVGLTTRRIQSEDDALTLLAAGARARATRTTEVNAGSSRSHAVLTLRVSWRRTAQSHRTSATLTLVDLAGSERGSIGSSTDATVLANRTHEEGLPPQRVLSSDLQSCSAAYLRAATLETMCPTAVGAAAARLAARKREATFINTSLSALGSVIASLAEASRGVPHESAQSRAGRRTASASPGVVVRYSSSQVPEKSRSASVRGPRYPRVAIHQGGRSHHIAFRSSLLTRLLQSSLNVERSSRERGGTALSWRENVEAPDPGLSRVHEACSLAPSIVVIATAGPCEETAEETLSTILFIMRARAIIPQALRRHTAPTSLAIATRQWPSTMGSEHPRARTSSCAPAERRRSLSPMPHAAATINKRSLPSNMRGTSMFAAEPARDASDYANSLARAELEVQRLRARLAAYVSRDAAAAKIVAPCKSAGTSAAYERATRFAPRALREDSALPQGNAQAVRLSSPEPPPARLRRGSVAASGPHSRTVIELSLAARSKPHVTSSALLSFFSAAAAAARSAHTPRTPEAVRGAPEKTSFVLAPESRATEVDILCSGDTRTERECPRLNHAPTVSTSSSFLAGSSSANSMSSSSAATIAGVGTAPQRPPSRGASLVAIYGADVAPSNGSASFTGNALTANKICWDEYAAPDPEKEPPSLPRRGRELTRKQK